MADALSGLSLSRGKTLAEQTSELLREMIVSGEIPANSVLTEYELARQLSISRSPLREALHRLQDEGLLESIGHRGVIVPPVTRSFVRNLYDVREALEVKAAELASPPPEADLQRARETLLAARSLLDTGDASAFTAADFDFHNLYIARCENPLLQKQVSRIRSSIRRVHIFANPLTDHIYQSADEHTAILEALESGAMEEVPSLVSRHIRGVSGRLAGYVES